MICDFWIVRISKGLARYVFAGIMGAALVVWVGLSVVSEKLGITR